MAIPKGNEMTEFKKLLSRYYNEVNKEIYGFGVNQLKISIEDNVIHVLVKHQRIVALTALELRHASTKLAVDHALHSEFKLRFLQKMEAKTDFKVVSILRDYDPSTEWASTLVILE
ncbi:Na-translocating system protein MpsC family protein [Paenibacillus timonensis]|uniref:Na-translocating system protein MpsC family protein n=1 Tax=Paenibacillus timonensis TaxID=225915 RepID=A0ABW3SC10_9BACL|nr:Na-translocating system protein MpsC family protein [Paenibacillus timonensis]MCH1640406.1 Na-translocating system protein MpsC family protein [Paenibacillus timonensis]